MHRHSTVTKDILLSCVLTASFSIAVMAVELAPSASGPVTIITDPFSRRSALDVIAATQGNILAAGRWPWIAVAASSDDPELQTKLKAAGALLLLPPLTNGCLKTLALQDL